MQPRETFQGHDHGGRCCSYVKLAVVNLDATLLNLGLQN